MLALSSGTASAETLFGAMAKAYENNPDLNAVRAALRATDENVTIAKAGMRPQIAATASARTSSCNSGWAARQYIVHAKALAVVSCPAT